jgi:hypothetical protein
MQKTKHKNSVRYFLLVCMLLLATPLLSAVELYKQHDASSVGRIIGNSPYDLVHQLDVDELNLNHATYLGNERQRTQRDSRIVQELFPKSSQLRGHFSDSCEGVCSKDQWSFHDIKEYAKAFQSNELFFVEGNGKKQPLRARDPYGGKEIRPGDTVTWKQEFAEHYPLTLLNFPYAGTSLPRQSGQDSFITELTRYSTILAPEELTSSLLPKAFMCNLGKYSTVGEVYRHARNVYYENIPVGLEIPGLVLQSYNLYGTPTSEVTLPKEYNEYDQQKLEEYCEGLISSERDHSLVAQEFSVQNNELVSTITKTYTLEHALTTTFTNHTLITIDDFAEMNIKGSMVLPYKIEKISLPADTMVFNVSVSFSNPEAVTANIPSWFDNYVDRLCIVEEEKEHADISIMQTETGKQVNIQLFPLEVVDCAEGEFNLYKTITYDIKYVSLSPMYFRDITNTASITPNTDFTLQSTLNYVNSNPLKGEIELYENGKLVYQKEVDFLVPSLTIPLTSLSEEGVTQYNLQYVEEGEVLVESRFEIETRLLDYTVHVPETVGSTANVVLEIYNHQDTPITVTVHDNLFSDEVAEDNTMPIIVHENTPKEMKRIDGSSSTYQVHPGKNEFTYTYTDLEKENQQYPLQFDLGYANKQEVVNDLITTNHKPVLDPLSDIEVREGEQVTLSVNALDKDNDALTYTISHPIGDDGVWDTTNSDVGEHVVTVAVSDGLAEDTAVIVITVTENFAPELESIEAFNVTAGESADVFLYATDANEDNLTYTIEDNRFINVEDDWFSWETNETDTGTQTFNYSVSDGLETVTDNFVVTVVAPEVPEIVDPCENVTCNNNYCDAFTQYSNGTCNAGMCEYTTEEHAESCGFDSSFTLLETFNDGSDSKVLEYEEEGEKIVYLRVPRGSTVHDAEVKLTVRGNMPAPIVPTSFSASGYSTSGDKENQEKEELNYNAQAGNACSKDGYDNCWENEYSDSGHGLTSRTHVRLAYSDNKQWGSNVHDGDAWYAVGDYRIDYYCEKVNAGVGDKFYSSTERATSEFDCGQKKCHEATKHADSGRITFATTKTSYTPPGGILCLAYDNATSNNGAWFATWATTSYDLNGPVYAVECYQDSDCSGTNRICDKSGLWNEWTCIDKPVCSANEECGSEGWVETPYCSGQDVMQRYRTPQCHNPGVSNAACGSTTSPQVKETCDPGQYCEDGACYNTVCSENNDCGPDENITDPYCVVKEGLAPGSRMIMLYPGPEVYHEEVNQDVRSFTCNSAGTVNSSCSSNTTTIVLDTCRSDEKCEAGECKSIACFRDSECGSNGYVGESYCKENAVYKKYQTNTCANPGIPSAMCSQQETEEFVEECSAGTYCSEGSCIEAACNNDNDCASSHNVGEPFCSVSNAVYSTTRTYICENPGTSNAACVGHDVQELVTSCDSICQKGSCLRGIQNPMVTVGSEKAWGHEGYFSESATISFTEHINTALSECRTDLCDIPIRVQVDSQGELELHDVYVVYESDCEGDACLTLPVEESFDVSISSSTPGQVSTHNNLIASSTEENVVYSWILDNTPIALVHMPFENGFNTTLTKDYARNHRGEVHGAVWNATAGHNNKGAYYFNGDDYIAIHNDADLWLQEGESRSVLAWVNPEVDGNMAIFQNGYSTGPGYYLIRRWGDGKQGNIGAKVQDDTSVCGIFSKHPVPLNTWTHVASTFDANTQTLSMYINGKLDNSKKCNPAIKDTKHNNNFHWGSDPNGDSGWKGYLDEGIMYNRALSAEQLQKVYEGEHIILSQETNPSESWRVIAETMQGTQSVSNTVTIEDDLPLINKLTVVSSNPNTNDPSQMLIAQAIVHDQSNVVYTWQVNDTNTYTLLNMPFEGVNKTGLNNAQDYSGNNLHGTVEGATWSATRGHDGLGAYVFDGHDDYINLGNNNLLKMDKEKDFTVTSWIHLEREDRENPIFSNVFFIEPGRYSIMPIQSDYALTITEANKLEAMMNDGTGNVCTVTSQEELPEQRWVHTSFTWDSTTQTLHVYINGELEGTQNCANLEDLWNGADVHIGRKGSSFFDGVIDEVRVFGKSLSQEQLKTLYHTKLTVIMPQETQPEQTWKVIAHPNNGEQDGLPLTAKLTIQHTPLKVTLPKTLTNDEHIIPHVEVEGISVYNWKVDGASFALVNMPFEGSNNQSITQNYATQDYGIVHRAMWNATAGKRGGAYVFDGDDYITYNTNPYLWLREGESMSVFTWAKPTQVGNEVIFQNGYSTGPGYYIRRRREQNHLGNVEVKIQDINNNICALYSTSTLDLHEWKHVGFTFDATTQTLSVYVNGMLENSKVCDAPLGDTKHNNDFRVGADPNGDGGWIGTLDELLIFKKVITPAQAKAYAQEENHLVPEETFPEQNWKLNVTLNDANGDITSVTSNPAEIIPNLLTDTMSFTLLSMPFEKTEVSIESVEDTSGNNLNGEERGEVLWNKQGGFDGNGAYTFNGNTGYIHIENNGSLDFGMHDFSISFWHKVNNYDNVEGAILEAGLNGYGGGNGIYISNFKADNGGSLLFLKVRDSEEHFMLGLCGKRDLIAEDWNHYTLTFDRSDGMKIRCYINGKFVDTSSTPIRGELGDGSNWAIGNRGGGEARNLNGAIDELVVYNSLLTPEQVSFFHIPAEQKPASFPQITNLKLEKDEEDLIVYADTHEDNKLIYSWLADGESISKLHIPFEGKETRDYSSNKHYSKEARNALLKEDVGFDGKGAVVFESDEYIEIENDGSLDFGMENFTISFWHKVNNHDTREMTILEAGLNGYGGGNGIYISNYATNNEQDKMLLLKIRDTEQLISATICKLQETPSTQWNQYTLTFTREEDLTITCYINGKYIDGGNHPLTKAFGDGSNWAIGNRGGGEARNLNGAIDEVIVYTRALSPNQIKSFYDYGNVLVQEEIKPGETWSVEVTPTNGVVNGLTKTSDTIKIEEIDTVVTDIDFFSLRSSNEGDLVASGESDESTKIIWNWFVDNVAFAKINMPFEGRKVKDYANNYRTKKGGEVVWNAEGGFDGKGAVVFNGEPGYLEIENDGSLDFKMRDFTISFWHKVNTHDNREGSILEAGLNGYGGGNGVYISNYVTNNEQDKMLLLKIRDTEQLVSMTTCKLRETPSTQWNQYTLTFTRNEGLSIDCYLNGKHIGTINQPITEPLGDGSNWAIGNRGGGEARNLNGAIDELMVYNHALSLEQVVSFYERAHVIVQEETSPGEVWIAQAIPTYGMVEGESKMSNSVKVE